MLLSVTRSSGWLMIAIAISVMSSGLTKATRAEAEAAEAEAERIGVTSLQSIVDLIPQTTVY